MSATHTPAENEGTEQIMPHSIHRETETRPGFPVTTKSVCSCGIDSAPTLAPQHLGRWERAHRNAHRMRKI